MSESVNETNNATTSVSSEGFFKGKFWKYAKVTGATVGAIGGIFCIAAVTTYGVLKVVQGECPVDIG